MALTELLFQIRNAEIGLVELDASVREMHSASATVTRHPIEAQPGLQDSVSDHVRPGPLTVQIDGVVTNHPAEWIGTFDSSETRDVQAHLELLTTLLSGTLITIATTLFTYEDMVLESLQVERDAKKGNALFLSATAVQVQLVELETTAGAGEPAGSTTAGGRQTATPADASTSASSQSALVKLIF